MPPVLLRLFSAQDSNTQPTMNTDERGEELKKTLGIAGRPPLSVTELEKQFLQSSTSQQPEKPVSNSENLPKPVPVAIKVRSNPRFRLTYFHLDPNTNDITTCYD